MVIYFDLSQICLNRPFEFTKTFAMSDRKKSQKDVENVREERRTKKDSDSKSQKKDRSERKEKTEKPNKKKDLIVQAVQVPRSAAIALFKAAGLGSTSGSEIKARLSVPKPKAK